MNDSTIVDVVTISVVMKPTAMIMMDIEIYAEIKWVKTEEFEIYGGKLSMEIKEMLDPQNYNDCELCRKIQQRVRNYDQMAELDLDVLEVKSESNELEQRVHIARCKNRSCKRIFIILTSRTAPEYQQHSGEGMIPVPWHFAMKLPRIDDYEENRIFYSRSNLPDDQQ